MPHTFYVGTQETRPNTGWLTLTDFPIGAPIAPATRGGLLRIMINASNEVNNQGNRAVAAWNAGLYPVVMLRTTAVPSVAQYRAQMINLLNIVAPVAGPRKCEWIECGNEPHGDLAFFLDCIKNSYDVVRARGVKVMLGAVVGGGTYRNDAGTLMSGPGALSRAIAEGYRGFSHSMYDGFALHMYSDAIADVPGGILRMLSTQRRFFPMNKAVWLTESGWPSPWPGSAGLFKQSYDEADRINKILSLFNGLRSRAETDNLHGWSYFAGSDYTGDSEHFNRCGLVNVSNAKKSIAVDEVRTSPQYGHDIDIGRGPGRYRQAWEAMQAIPGATPVGGTVALPTPPEAVTNPASLIQPTTATLNGSVDANGLATTYHFEWDTNSGVPYANSSTETGAGAGLNPVAVSHAVTGLSASTRIYFRIVAANNDGIDAGGELFFDTAAAAGTLPAASTMAPPTAITDDAANLRGSVNPNGSDTDYLFQYGLAAGSLTSSTGSQGPLTGSSFIPVSIPATSLSPATIYYYRVVATNTVGTTNGSTLSFTTQAASSSSTPPAALGPPPGTITEAVKGSHTLAVRCEVLRDGVTVGEPEIISGSVTYDAKAAIRATCEITLADDGSLGWIPNIAADTLAPYGNELKLYRGVDYGDTSELVSLGIFRINEMEASDTPEGVEIRVSGADRSAAVSDAKFEQDPPGPNPDPGKLAFPSGTKFTDLILRVVNDAVGNVPVSDGFADVSVKTTFSLIAEEGEDRWEFVQGLATALVSELYFDDEGVLTIAPIPDAEQEPVGELVEDEGGLLLEASKRWSRGDSFNKVIVTGENSELSPAVRAEMADNNVLSPTYYGGRFGRIPRFYTNQFVTTQTQAEDVAKGILRAELGVTQSIDFGAIVIPTLRASDVVAIRRQRLGVSEAHVIDQLTIPLDAESPMTGTTRMVYPLIAETRQAHLLLSPETLLFPEQVIF